MSDWREGALGDLIELKRGYDLPKANRRPGAVPIVSSSGITDYHNEVKVRGPGVVTGRYGTIGSVYYITDDFWPLNTTLYVKNFKGNDPRFVGYFLQTINFLAYSDKAAVPGVNRNHLHVAKIRYPADPMEQRSIASILGALDDKIELNRRMNETLEEMARTLFKDWFVDFGPTRAKMEGREPYLAPELWELFPERLDDEGKPEGWQARPVGDFAELRGGKQLEKKRISTKGTIPVFGGAGVMGFTDRHNADGFVISVGRVGAYCGQFFSHRGKAWINNNASLIRPLGSVSAEWLFQSLRHADIEVIKKGAAQPFVSNTDIANMPIMWPGENIVLRFTEILAPMMLKIEQNNGEASTLAATRDLLLPKLMSGEIRVKDAEKTVESVV